MDEDPASLVSRSLSLFLFLFLFLSLWPLLFCLFFSLSLSLRRCVSFVCHCAVHLLDFSWSSFHCALWRFPLRPRSSFSRSASRRSVPASLMATYGGGRHRSCCGRAGEKERERERKRERERTGKGGGQVSRPKDEKCARVWRVACVCVCMYM